MQMIRRQALAAIAGVLAGVASNDERRSSPGDSQDYRDLAAKLADSELAAVKRNRPDWEKVHYVNLLRWHDEAILFFGVGRPNLVDEDCARSLAIIGELAGGLHVRCIAGIARTACRRSWCIIVQAIWDDDCLSEICPPDWNRDDGRTGGVA